MPPGSRTPTFGLQENHGGLKSSAPTAQQFRLIATIIRAAMRFFWGSGSELRNKSGSLFVA
jgi:hypothetical protein